jgi:hypothetical protein
VKITVDYEDQLTWEETRTGWVGYSGKHRIVTIEPHYVTDTPCFTWFEDHSDEIDNSITGSIEFLKEKAQYLWKDYLRRMVK